MDTRSELAPPWIEETRRWLESCQVSTNIVSRPSQGATLGSIAYVYVLKEKRRKLDAKTEKCILVGYLDDVVFDKSTSWYLPSTPTPDDSIPISHEEISEVEIPRDEGDIRAL